MGNSPHCMKSIVIRDAMSIFQTNQVQAGLPGGGDDSDDTVPGSSGESGAYASNEALLVRAGERSSSVASIEFFGLESALSEWQPSDPNVERSSVIAELDEFLREKGIQTRVGKGPDILVCERYPVDVERGITSVDVDRLLERMLWDSYLYGCIIGLMYGVESQEIADQLESALKSFFEESDLATIVIC